MRNKKHRFRFNLPAIFIILGVFVFIWSIPVLANGVNYISRAIWGANEKLRVYTEERPEAQLVKLPEDFHVRYAQELKLRKIVSNNQNGDPLTWPLQYPEKVSKIFIHHTATTKGLDDPKEAIRDIYYYHTIGRGWGDIGYNYVIDLEGNIYEGRAGGESVVGAHAGPGNRGSIGIAILGNYNDEKLTAKSLQTLKELLSQLTKMYGIDPVGTSYFRGVKSPNIMGHREIMSTSCPGENVVKILQKIRTDIALMNGNFDYNKIPEEFMNLDYAFDYLPTLEEIKMPPDRSLEYTIRLKNIGEKAWNKDTYLRADYDYFTKEGFYVSHANIAEQWVNPGEIATFKVKIRSKLLPGFFYLNFKPIFNGEFKTIQELNIPTLVDKPIFAYEFISSKLPKNILETGESALAVVQLKNTGNVNWRNFGENRISLGADNERDRVSSFSKSTRMGYLQNSTVKPGETGQFVFTLTAPKYPGLYEEYFAPVIERITWLEGNGMKFIIKVINT